MSWLTDLAGKAEGLLNNLDQSAAQALHKPPGQAPYHYSHQSTTSNYDPVPPTKRTDHRSSGYASSVSSLRRAKNTTREEEDESSLQEHHNPLSRRSSSSSLRSLPAHLARTAVTTEDHEGPPHISAVLVEERDVKELQAREADLKKALQAKDSQLAVLRVRLQEAEQLLESKTQALKRIESEQQRLLKDSVDSSAYKNQAMETVQQQLRDAQAALDKDRFQAKQTEAQLHGRIHKLEGEQADLMQQLTAAQKALTEEKLRCKQAAEQLKLAKYNLEANKQEFDEYKQKAQRVLQTKEKLLDTLKESQAGPASDQAGLVVELEELRTERDLIKEDLQQAQLHLFNLKAEFQELESQLATEQRQALEQQYQLQEQCQQYQHFSAQYREQLDQMKQEYQYMQDEARRHQSALQTKLHEKDAEITRLMNQVTARASMTAGDASDLDNRVRQLTESLIHKQTIIETLQTDKKSMELQLERTERLYREAESAAVRASATTTLYMGGAGEEGGVHARVPSFLRESPQDTGVTRSVKRAYTSVDSLSVKVGVFLRRYPAARVCVFCYIVLLHIWVMVVLLTYTPEAHSPDYHQPRDRSS